MKNFKNSIRLLGLFIFLIGSQPVFAQGNAHAEKDKKEQTKQGQKEKEIRDAYKQRIKNAKGQEKKELEEELERELQKFQEKTQKNNKFDNGQADANQKKAKKNKKDEKGQPDSKENQGNAYGKNKGGLEGREFGQARAADARAKVNQYNTRLTERRQVVILGKRKIEGARIRLAEYKKNNTLTPKVIAEREARVVVFERKLNAFEAAVEEAIRKNEAKREQLLLFYEQD